MTAQGHPVPQAVRDRPALSFFLFRGATTLLGCPARFRRLRAAKARSASPFFLVAAQPLCWVALRDFAACGRRRHVPLPRSSLSRRNHFVGLPREISPPAGGEGTFHFPVLPCRGAATSLSCPAKFRRLRTAKARSIFPFFLVAAQPLCWVAPRDFAACGRRRHVPLPRSSLSSETTSSGLVGDAGCDAHSARGSLV